MNDNQYRLAYLKKHHINEKWALPVFYKALKESIKPVLTYLQHVGPTGVEFIQLNHEPIQKALLTVHLHIGQKEARWEYYNVLNRPEEKSVSFYYPAWQRLITQYMLEHSGVKITSITNTVREKIRYLLAYASDQNMTLYETTKYLTENLQSKDFLFGRAAVIARTETTSASNFAHLLAADTLEIQTEKRWVATEDNRTRRTHMAANGQQVDQEEKFKVGQSLMVSPGDPTAPAKEVVNCRCVVRMIPVYDSSGMPVRKPVTLQYAL